MPTLRQLRYFDALARHRHFGRAAEACAISQPALSMQIRAFETELEADLLERRRGAVVLTEIGSEVATRAQAILSAVRDLADGVRRSQDEPTLRLGVIPTLAPYVLPRILPALDRFEPEFLIISAGFDAHRRDPLAQLNLEVADFAWVTRELLAIAGRHCAGRVVSALEGGYDLEALAASTAAHVAELMAA